MQQEKTGAAATASAAPRWWIRSMRRSSRIFWIMSGLKETGAVRKGRQRNFSAPPVRE